MSKYATYVAKATDADGEVIYEQERFTALHDEAAWKEAVRRAFDKRKAERRAGHLVANLAELQVTRL